jgi:hypothetical protein
LPPSVLDGTIAAALMLSSSSSNNIETRDDDKGSPSSSSSSSEIHSDYISNLVVRNAPRKMECFVCVSPKIYNTHGMCVPRCDNLTNQINCKYWELRTKYCDTKGVRSN